MEFIVRPRGHSRGRVHENATSEELWDLSERIIMMERWGVCPEEMSDKEESTKEAKPQGEVNLVRLFKMVVAAHSRSRSKVLTYDGSLNEEELISWINALDKYFDYEEVDEAKQLKFAITNLRGHASI